MDVPPSTAPYSSRSPSFAAATADDRLGRWVIKAAVVTLRSNDRGHQCHQGTQVETHGVGPAALHHFVHQPLLKTKTQSRHRFGHCNSELVVTILENGHAKELDLLIWLQDRSRSNRTPTASQKQRQPCGDVFSDKIWSMWQRLMAYLWHICTNPYPFEGHWKTQTPSAP